MATHKSAIKRLRQSKKKRVRNRNIKGAVRTAIKKTKASAIAGNFEEAETNFKLAERSLAKASTKGILHKKSASRSLSRLAKFIKNSKTSKAA